MMPILIYICIKLILEPLYKMGIKKAVYKSMNFSKIVLSCDNFLEKCNFNIVIKIN